MRIMATQENIKETCVNEHNLSIEIRPHRNPRDSQEIVNRFRDLVKFVPI